MEKGHVIDLDILKYTLKILTHIQSDVLVDYYHPLYNQLRLQVKSIYRSFPNEHSKNYTLIKDLRQAYKSLAESFLKLEHPPSQLGHGFVKWDKEENS